MSSVFGEKGAVEQLDHDLHTVVTPMNWLLRKKKPSSLSKLVKTAESNIDLAFDHHVKIVVIGPKAAGKTCLNNCFNGHSLFQRYQNPFPFITFELDDIRIRLDVYELSRWDAIGYEPNPIHVSWDEIETEWFMNRAHGFVLVFSVTDRKSFNEIDVFLQCVYKNSDYIGVSKCAILIGNKCDLEDERQVSFVEAKDFAIVKGMLYIEVSAKDRTNVDLIIPTLTTLIIYS